MHVWNINVFVNYSLNFVHSLNTLVVNLFMLQINFIIQFLVITSVPTNLYTKYKYNITEHLYEVCEFSQTHIGIDVPFAPIYSL